MLNSTLNYRNWLMSCVMLEVWIRSLFCIFVFARKTASHLIWSFDSPLDHFGLSSLCIHLFWRQVDQIYEILGQFGQARKYK